MFWKGLDRKDAYSYLVNMKRLPLATCYGKSFNSMFSTEMLSSYPTEMNSEIRFMQTSQDFKGTKLKWKNAFHCNGENMYATFALASYF